MDEIKEYIYLHDKSLSTCITLVVQNDEMTNASAKYSFNVGEKIIIDLERKPELNNFVIAHLKNSDDLTFKQYIKHADKYYLKSLNPQYPLIEINDDIEIVGIVVSKYNLTVLEY